MFLKFMNTITSNKHKLLSLSNLPLLLYLLLPFLGEMFPPPIVGHPLIKAGSRTLQKNESLGERGEGVSNFLLERWDKPEKGGLM